MKTADPNFLKEQADRCRRLAEQADPFTKERLLNSLRTTTDGIRRRLATNRAARYRLLRYLNSRATEFLGKVFEFRQAIPHRKNCLRVVDMHPGAEFERW